ncbi:unnamed protein product [Trifolium pratense]|uniref:Uncharacterized protein n=1 Tax=Trifolium pratense TaxID=57577 RepID=A0ACB0I7Z8_TRIPR|nr:unnamed protein product [Trifolium pratense]
MVTNWRLDCRKRVYPCKGAFLVNELIFLSLGDSIYVFSRLSENDSGIRLNVYYFIGKILPRVTEAVIVHVLQLLT